MNSVTNNVEELTTITADFQTRAEVNAATVGNRSRTKPDVQLCPLSHFSESRRQFLLSQIISLAKEELKDVSNISIKWPNDIYWKDKKICGMLIENDLTGVHISRSITGSGSTSIRKRSDDAQSRISEQIGSM